MGVYLPKQVFAHENVCCVRCEAVKRERERECLLMASCTLQLYVAYLRRLGYLIQTAQRFSSHTLLGHQPGFGRGKFVASGIWPIQRILIRILMPPLASVTANNGSTDNNNNQFLGAKKRLQAGILDCRFGIDSALAANSATTGWYSQWTQLV